MKSPVVKRSIVLAGHKTSVSLEDAFWEGLKEIAKIKRRSCLI
jgi:predicted DNA-binding ribbon-helix-helix protein